MDKATRKALKHLTYVPRFRSHTIHYPLTVLYGKTKVRLAPQLFLLLYGACCWRPADEQQEAATQVLVYRRPDSPACCDCVRLSYANQHPVHCS